MTTSTRLRRVLARAGLVLTATAAFGFAAACNDASPAEDGDQQQEQQDDGGGDDDGGGGGGDDD